MKTASCLLFLSLLLSLNAEEPVSPSPIKASEISGDNSRESVEAARVRGTASAQADIKRQNFRVLYYGKPWSSDKPLVDEATGYRVQIVGGCDCTTVFRAEVEAYNSEMKEHHKKTSRRAESLIAPCFAVMILTSLTP